MVFRVTNDDTPGANLTLSLLYILRLEVCYYNISAGRQSSRSYPSPGTSLSLSPSAWSWLEKLTNSAPSSPSWGRFLRSFTMARRAALSSLLRSSSLFLLLRTGFDVCFLDMLADLDTVGLQHQNLSTYGNEQAFASTTAIHLEPKKTQKQGLGDDKFC